MLLTKHLLFYIPDGVEGGNDNVNTDTPNSDVKTVPLADLIAERKKRQDFQKELDAIKQKQKEADEAKLLEEGKLKEVLSAKEKEFDAIKQKQKEADEAKLLEEGKLKEVLSAKEKEFDEYKKSIEQDLKLASEFKEFQTKRRDVIKEKLGDKWVESFSNIPLTDLEVLSEKLSVVPNAVTTNNGTGAGANSVTLTATEKAEAERMGLSEEGYIKFKETRAKLKGN